MESFSIKEKLVYENERGQSIELSVHSPFFIEKATGFENMKNNIYTMKNVGEDGESDVGSTLDKRNIVLEGSIIENKDTNREKMISIFNPKLKGRLMYSNSKITRYIKCSIEESPTISKDRFPKFVVSLLCSNPYWYGEEYRTDVAIWKCDFHFPLIIPKTTGITMGHREPSLIVNIFNASDVECPMRIEFKALATLSNPSLFNVVTREFIKINRNMVAGEVIKINTKRGSERVELYKSGIMSNIFNDLDIDSEFLKLDVGDNLLRYDAETNIDNLEVTIYHLPQYVGV